MRTRPDLLEDFRNRTCALLAAYAWVGLLAFEDDYTQIQLTPLGRRTAQQLPPHHSPTQPLLARLHARLRCRTAPRA